MHKLSLIILPFVLCLVCILNSWPSVVKADERGDREYWLRRKAEFYRNTTFPLSDFNLQLVGRKRTIFENKSTLPVGHLPFWFDYELFKKVFNKAPANDQGEELSRHNVYINTCLRTIKLRTLFRMLSGTKDTLIESDADRFFWEKAGHLKDAGMARPADDEISMAANFKFEPEFGTNETPLDRAIRLMKVEMDQVESKNQVETYLRAFNEIDGSAIDGHLPY